MMPFIGVRISWLTVARKRDFAWLANSARSRAVISAVSARLRAVMSRAMARCETASLALSRTDSSIHENQRTPFGVRIATSVELRHSPSEKAASGTTPTSMPSSASVCPGKLGRLAADKIGKDAIGVDDPPVAVAVHDKVAERVDEAAKAFLALLQLPHAVGQRLVFGDAALGGRVDFAPQAGPRRAR